VGIEDEPDLRAIEAAVLLHDMGKLSIPAGILNKPGKLTPAEFERVKQHVTVAAQILSQIDFPYPVVPVVRHHHEHWDGTGYPDGLKGEAIPIGARVMAVVDCYDALTSHRSYRPAIANVDALRIILDRRGSVYDPRVVDAFVGVIAQFTASEGPGGEPAQATAPSAAAAAPAEGQAPVNALAATRMDTGGCWQ
jgi:HD-GYP domain-containing protein (c-di-GMP phosphodiesterase class II)